MDQNQLNAIKERFEETTEGPWYAIAGRIYNGQVQIPWTCEDAEFIAQTHKDVPALVAEVERLREVLKGAAVVSNQAKGLVEENKRLRKALEFYAEESKYERVELCDGDKEIYIECDGGEIARQALGGEAHE